MVSKGTLRIKASNGLFGDPLYGWGKTMVIYYEAGNREFTKFCTENQYIDLTDIPRLKIDSAVYGRKVVTDDVQALVDKGVTRFTASNKNFGDSWYGTLKTFTVTYTQCNGKD